MAFLVNRTAAARIECLHALAQLIVVKFGSYGKPFHLKDVKFDRDSENIHSFCTLLKEDDIAGHYCRFKENPLDDAGCSITNGVSSDSTKSKEVSNTINAMHALGFVKRDGSKIEITSFGYKFSTAKYDSEEMHHIIKKAVQNYGPVVGVLSWIQRNYKIGDKFNIGDIRVGYPEPEEYVNHNGERVLLSAGSTQDTNTRTRSCIIAWLTTAGFIRPVNVTPVSSPYPQIAYRDYINREHRMEQIYEVIDFPSVETTKHPLNYDNLTKMNFCLRENGMTSVREATRYYEGIIKNRRFAILYLLNMAYENRTTIALNEIIEIMRSHPNLFVVSDEDLEDTISAEIEIAFMAGIPYILRIANGQSRLQPLKGLNIEELQVGAPQVLINTLNMYEFNG
ncbi:MAG: hypothetical protein IJ845_07990 [Bacteroidaceae bacterium]|nr:hypothetical protein [Bacteroidaceae bacterium]